MSKAKVISVLNHKGGVGKTTTTINLGGALRQKGYKVLLIDLDGQANLTESLGFSAELPQTIYGAMKGEYDLPIYEHKDGLSVVPSCLDLSAVETELINEAGSVGNVFFKAVPHIQNRSALNAFQRIVEKAGCILMCQTPWKLSSCCSFSPRRSWGRSKSIT